MFRPLQSHPYHNGYCLCWALWCSTLQTQNKWQATVFHSNDLQDSFWSKKNIREFCLFYSKEFCDDLNKFKPESRLCCVNSNFICDEILKLVWSNASVTWSRIKIIRLLLHFAVWGTRFEKTLTAGHCFQKNSRFQGKTMANQAKHLLWHLLWGSTIAVITPMRQACTCGRVRDPGLTPSAPKQWKSDIFMFRVKTLSAQKRTKSNKENNRESAAI